MAHDVDFAGRVLAAATVLKNEVAGLKFSEPVTHVINPLDYAWELHAAWVRTWGASPRRVLFLGMNPGPWGMAQTGVPFGEVAAVRDWLRLRGTVRRPAGEHPRRPIRGLDCPRSEVSGRRLWGFFAERFGSPTAFFREHFVLNYCPLVFMEAGGRNRTPDKLPAGETTRLFGACDRRLRDVVRWYAPRWVVGVGGFATRKLEALFGAQAAAAANGIGAAATAPRIGTVLHPSPASPLANRGWAQAAEKQLREQEIW